jgi:hypothetical protein
LVRNIAVCRPRGYIPEEIKNMPAPNQRHMVLSPSVT